MYAFILTGCFCFFVVSTGRCEGVSWEMTGQRHGEDVMRASLLIVVALPRYREGQLKKKKKRIQGEIEAQRPTPPNAPLSVEVSELTVLHLRYIEL